VIVDVQSVRPEAPTRRDASSASALLGQGVVVIWNDVAAEGRDQFYAWHDNEHVPERLAIPGFRRGRRFTSPAHSPEWLTLYEVSELSVVTSAPYLARLNAPTPATTSALEHFRNTSRAACRVVHSCGASTGGHVLAMRLSVPEASGDPMCRYLRDEAFPRLMACTGIVACHLLAADESGSYVKTAESSTRAFDVPSWVLLCEASRAASAASARGTIEGRAFDALGINVRDDAAIYALEICRLSSPSPDPWKR